jgi:hypothetical protein
MRGGKLSYMETNNAAAAYEFSVVNIETKEVLGNYDSLYLAKQSVCCINRNVGRKVVKVVRNF